MGNVTSLKDALISVPVPDISGATTAGRYAFQRSWAVAEALKRHASGDDYTFIFEFHDDVLILDSASEPTVVEFCQVKTKKNKKWTATELIAKRSRAKQSVLGKLFRHALAFDGFNYVLCLVTNSGFNFCPDTGSYVFADTLDEPTKEKIKDKILAEIPDLTVPPLDRLRFICTSLSLDDHSAHVLGLIVNFLDNHLGADHGVHAKAFLITLDADVERKSMLSVTNFESFGDFVKRKGIARNEMEARLIQLKAAHSQLPLWADIRSILISEGWKALRLLGLQTAWRELSTDRLNVENHELSRFLDALRARVNKCSTSGSLSEVLAQVLVSIKSGDISSPSHYSKNYIEACIIWVHCEEQTV